MRWFFALLLWVGLACGAQAQVEARAAFAFAENKEWELAKKAALGNPALLRAIEWRYVASPDSGASFAEIAAFLREHPDWPERESLFIRAEAALSRSGLSVQEKLNWFRQNPPASSTGKLAYVEAQIASGVPTASLTAQLQDAWIGADVGEDEERRILSTYGAYLTQATHEARMERLLWEDKRKSAQRMMALVPAKKTALYHAWLALLANDKNAPRVVAKLPAKDSMHAGLLFARIAYRDKQDDEQGVAELLAKAPKEVPYPKRWWKFRERAVREAVFEKDYARARRLLKNHGQQEGSEAAEALWLSGWVQLQAKGDAGLAYLDFYQMYERVQFAVSKARAAFWAAKAAERLGDKEVATSWYRTAMAFPTTFYGQRAAEVLHVDVALSKTMEAQVSAAEMNAFLQTPLGATLAVCVAAEDMRCASALMRHAIDSTKDAKRAAIVARAMHQLGSRVLSVKAAKRGLQHNLLLTDIGYPTISLPRNLAIEPALALALIRQESEFDPFARSGAGAVGLMQLLPSTAREVARKLGVEAEPLTDEATNITLGSAYMARLLASVDGSLPMAIASYNAGPGRVRQWEAQFGHAGNSWDEMIEWSEHIPFEETRNYVHRVLENYTVYKQLGV